ncbi:acid phosphatase AphA [Psychromonas sp. KJ10-2]|uniref:acid phosphatase AphA n=1 Tax=Psychromonas sp. KJ10-2 TaxID=3391822 RepID=UPI0039B60D60
MKKSLLTLSLIASSFLSSSVIADPKTPGTQAGYSTAELLSQGIPDDLNTVSVEALTEELKGKPAMSVGFDIDDTVLFSSPVFYRGQQEFSPSGYSYLSNQQFWDKANCGWDAFSQPKTIASKLIAMHQARGDDIYFITARTPSDCDFMTTYIKKTFDIKQMHDVIFSGTSKEAYLKAPYIKQHNIKIYYGDADGDIISARQAGAEGIRIMRAANSSYKPLPKNGLYGERVVLDSQY